MSRLIFTLLAFSFALPAVAAEPFKFPEGKHGKGELKYVNGIPVLVLAGTPEEMGEQMGVLGLKPAAGAVSVARELLKQRRLDLIVPVLKRFGEAMLAKYPEAYRREFEAMAKHGGIDRDLLVIGNLYSELRHLNGCSGVAIDAGRSATGGPLTGHNWDWPPIAGMHQYQLVVVWRPAGKKPFAVVGFPGVVAASAQQSSFNADGLAMGSDEVNASADGAPQVDWEKMPSSVICRRILEECATAADVEKLVRADRPAERQALVVCDRAGGAVLEVTPKTVAVRRGDGGVCWATNHCRSKELLVPAAAKCWRADTFVRMKWPEKIGPGDVAKGLHAVNQKAWTAHTWVFEPKTLKLRLALGDGKTSATERPLTEIDLAPLLRPADVKR
jgi:hypothetical protein